jgi:hypothetical protein
MSATSIFASSGAILVKSPRTSDTRFEGDQAAVLPPRGLRYQVASDHVVLDFEPH